MRKHGIEARSIHNRKTQGARTDLLRDFKQGNLRILVTTDLLSRRIDIEFLPFVITYELPRSPINFIHRIGRTGRAGRFGETIPLVSPVEEAHFKVMEKKMRKKVPRIVCEQFERCWGLRWDVLCDSGDTYASSWCFVVVTFPYLCYGILENSEYVHG